VIERSSIEVNMTVTREEEKPWKTDLARKAAQRREQVGQELEELIKKAPSFEEALRQSVELMKQRFAKFSSVTAYVADGEELAVHTALERPQGPERVASSGGVLADAAQGTSTTVFTDLSASPAWAQVGLASGSAMVAPVRTDAGLWAILEVWSDFRAAFSPQDQRLLARVAQALARKTPAA
jgi:putative methionine-R-sulfoxide reductase with GAF domain